MSTHGEILTSYWGQVLGSVFGWRYTGMPDKMGKMLRVDRVESILRPIFWFSRVIGVFPFTEDYLVSLGGLSSALFAFAAYTYMTVLYFSIMIRRPLVSQTTFGRLLYGFGNVLMLVSIGAIVGRFLTKRRLLRRALLHMNRVEQALRAMGIEVKYSRTYTSALCFYLATYQVLSCALFFLGYRVPSVYERIVIYVANVGIDIPLSVVKVQFCAIAYAIEKQLKLVRLSLKCSGFFARRSSVENTLALHSGLLLVYRAINEVYSVAMLFTFTASFINFTSNAYLMSFVLKRALTHKDKFELWLTRLSSEIAFSAISVVLLAGACERIKQETDLFKRSMLRLMSYNLSIYKSPKLRCYIFGGSRVKFTALGFFSVNYSTVHSFLAAAVSYIFILIQFNSAQLKN